MASSAWGLDVKDDDSWDSDTKTLTVNSNPGHYQIIAVGHCAGCDFFMPIESEESRGQDNWSGESNSLSLVSLCPHAPGLRRNLIFVYGVLEQRRTAYAFFVPTSPSYYWKQINRATRAILAFILLFNRWLLGAGWLKMELLCCTNGATLVLPSVSKNVNMREWHVNGS